MVIILLVKFGTVVRIGYFDVAFSVCWIDHFSGYDFWI